MQMQMWEGETDITLLLLKLFAFTRSGFACINKTVKIILDNVRYFDVYKHNNCETEKKNCTKYSI